jgi:hypothetical protein
MYTDLFTRSVVLRVARRIRDINERLVDDIVGDIINERPFAGNCDECCLPVYGESVFVGCDQEYCGSIGMRFCTTRPYYCEAYKEFSKCVQCDVMTCCNCLQVCVVCKASCCYTCAGASGWDLSRAQRRCKACSEQ